MAIERAPICAGEFIGYRVWEVHLHEDIPTLRSWVYQCFWLPGKVVSDISYTQPGLCEGPIDDTNQRGVWAFKTPELLRDDFKQYSLRRHLVYGSCYMWGTIIEHELGYRSQYARVLSIDEKQVGNPMVTDWYSESEIDQPAIDIEFLRKRYGV